MRNKDCSTTLVFLPQLLPCFPAGTYFKKGFWLTEDKLYQALDCQGENLGTSVTSGLVPGTLVTFVFLGLSSSRTSPEDLSRRNSIPS